MASITFTLTGDTSSLNSYFYPEIELDEESEYSCCLLDFFTYNSIANINEKNNKFYFIVTDARDFEYSVNNIESIHGWDNGDVVEFMYSIVVPVGSYEIDEIIEFLNKEFKKQDVNIKITCDKNTMKCCINSELIVDFTPNDCIGSVLGFSKKRLPKGENKSNKLIDIQHINNLRIDCDLVTGSFHNGKNTHTIYEFYPNVDPGYKISEHPKHLIYLPVNRRRISTVNISVVDQDGRLIDFRGEQITCRLHIKRDK